LVSKKLKDRLGDVFEIKLIEIFSPESFSYKEIIEGIQNEKLQTPVVMIDDEIVQSGGKLSERNLKEEIERRLSGFAQTKIRSDQLNLLNQRSIKRLKGL